MVIKILDAQPGWATGVPQTSIPFSMLSHPTTSDFPKELLHSTHKSLSFELNLAHPSSFMCVAPLVKFCHRSTYIASILIAQFSNDLLWENTLLLNQKLTYSCHSLLIPWTHHIHTHLSKHVIDRSILKYNNNREEVIVNACILGIDETNLMDECQWLFITRLGRTNDQIAGDGVFQEEGYRLWPNCGCLNTFKIQIFFWIWLYDKGAQSAVWHSLWITISQKKFLEMSFSTTDFEQ